MEGCYLVESGFKDQVNEREVVMPNPIPLPTIDLTISLFPTSILFI